MASEELEDLQARISFQEDALASLNNVVASQNLELKKLQDQLQLLYKRFAELKSDLDAPHGGGQGLDAPPPHY